MSETKICSVPENDWEASVRACDAAKRRGRRSSQARLESLKGEI